MRVFLAGATGAIGRRLVPLLTANGNEVIGTTRSPDKGESLRRLGAEPVVMDGLDRGAVLQAVTGAEPDIVIQQQTALSGKLNMRRFDQSFAVTNELRHPWHPVLARGGHRGRSIAAPGAELYRAADGLVLIPNVREGHERA